MTLVIILAVVLILGIGVYARWAWSRSGTGTVGDVVKTDLGDLEKLLQNHQPDQGGGMFVSHGRQRLGVSPTPTPVSRTRAAHRGTTPVIPGRGRQVNPKARCWECGQQMTPGHKH